MSTGTCHHGNPANGTCLYCRADRGEVQVFSGPVFPCPQCVRFREKMDREKMATTVGDCCKVSAFEALVIADALIKYLTE